VRPPVFVMPSPESDAPVSVQGTGRDSQQEAGLRVVVGRFAATFAQERAKIRACAGPAHRANEGRCEGRLAEAKEDPSPKAIS
jgi:hypothetical protein